jgi:amino acid transporter
VDGQVVTTPGPERKSSPLAVAKAVFFSFLGIRKSSDYQKDAAKITPQQAIIGGLIGAAIFIATLITIVQLVLRK